MSMIGPYRIIFTGADPSCSLADLVSLLVSEPRLELSDCVTGSKSFVDFSYGRVQISAPTQGALVFEVAGRIDWDRMGDDEGPGEEDGPWAEGWDDRKSREDM